MLKLEQREKSKAGHREGDLEALQGSLDKDRELSRERLAFDYRHKSNPRERLKTTKGIALENTLIVSSSLINCSLSPIQ